MPSAEHPPFVKTHFAIFFSELTASSKILTGRMQKNT